MSVLAMCEAVCTNSVSACVRSPQRPSSTTPFLGQFCSGTRARCLCSRLYNHTPIDNANEQPESNCSGSSDESTVQTPASTINLSVKPMAQLVKDYDFGFPMKSVDQLDNIERNILSDDKYASSLIGFLKSKPGTLRQNFPKLFTDEFTEQFNWDGIGENKFAIRHRVFISHILYEVYKDTIEGNDPQKYGQEVRKAIRLSRMRVMRGKTRQKKQLERSKIKRFNYFHYP